MKGKVLLLCVLISGGLATSCQFQVKQMVSAETKVVTSIESEPETKVESNSAIAKETLAESTAAEENFSSIEESQSSEAVASTSSITLRSDSEKQEEETTGSTVPVSIIPAATVQTNLPAAKVEENFQVSVVKNQTTEEFIETIGKEAQVIAWDEGLYASVMIAQAILETGSGNSQLARPPHHNLFGIKGSYRGKNVSFNTQEDKGNGQLYTIQSAFRQYPSYKESLEDYAALLKNGISGNAGFYHAAWKEYAETYRIATKALTGKYATDTAYDKKLNALIETYELTTFDVEPGAKEPNAVSETMKAFSEDSKVSEEQLKNEGTESNTTEEPKILTNETKQTVVTIPPVIQRPAKEVAGNRTAQ